MKIYLFIFANLFLLNAYALDNTINIHSTSSANSQSRYEIIQSNLNDLWTYRIDKVCGEINQLVIKNSVGIGWKKMKVHNLPKCNLDGKIRYQLFTSGLAARHTFLINNENGKTWRINIGEQGPDASEWFPFEE